MSNFRYLTDGDDSYRATEDNDWVVGEAGHADIINLNGWTGGVPNTGAVTQSGADVLITFSDWNDIRVVNAVVDDVLAHIVW